MLPRPPRPTLFPYTTLFRSEARQEIAVRHVELEHVEARRVRELGGADVLPEYGGEVLLLHRPRHLRDRQVGQRRGRHERPVALVERQVDTFPEELRRPLSPGVTELRGDLRARVAVDELDDPPPIRHLLLVPEPRAARRED